MHRRVNFVFEWQHQGGLSADVGGNNTAMVTYDGNGYEIVKGAKFSPKTPDATTGNYLQTFSHVFREDEALVSYCAPWSNTRLASLVRELQADPRVTVASIGSSKLRNLPITYFRITDKALPDKQKRKVLIVGREDSYEAGGSWAAEGMVRFTLSDDAVAREMLKKVVFYVFPIFSVDGVAMGHTNFPLNTDGSDYVYVTAKWDLEPPYHEVKMMKDFWGKIKAAGEEIDVKSALQARDEEAVLAAIAESLECKTFDKNVLPGRTARGMSQVGG
jgi:murein tripeptide amidase MpaA